MSYPIKADIVPLVKGVVQSLKPFARVHGSSIQMRSISRSWHTMYEPDILVPQLCNVIIRIITLSKENSDIQITIAVDTKVPDRNLNLIINTEGIDEGSVRMLNDESSPIVITTLEELGRFNVSFPLALTMKLPNYREKKDHSLIKPWYNEIRKRLTNHFKSIDNLEKAAAFRGEAEAEYLRRVNDLIQSRMHCENFHVEELAKSLHISRAQLFRKLKPLVQMSPGRYIRFVRLESAREILQKGTHNVTEAAFAVGFVNVSHFSRSFYKQFGFSPSQLSKKMT